MLILTPMGSGGWTQKYVYDRWGNRALTNNSYMQNAALTAQVAGETNEAEVAAQFPGNRWTGAVYDAAGNQTAVGSWLWAYDGENRVKTAVWTATGGGPPQPVEYF